VYTRIGFAGRAGPLIDPEGASGGTNGNDPHEVCLEPDPEGRFIAVVPALPRLATPASDFDLLVDYVPGRARFVADPKTQTAVRSKTRRRR